jgi:succinyl-diaminopimelate desuccinylase
MSEDAASSALCAAVAAEREGMIALAAELIALPTENPPGYGYREAVRLLVERLGDLGFHDTRVEGHCVLTFLGEGDRTLYWSGHYDVVPAQEPAQFVPRVEGANLFGRGSSDMKGGLAAMIHAAKVVRDRGLLTRGRLGLVFVAPAPHPRTAPSPAPSPAAFAG